MAYVQLLCLLHVWYMSIDINIYNIMKNTNTTTYKLLLHSSGIILV